MAGVMKNQSRSFCLAASEKSTQLSDAVACLGDRAQNNTHTALQRVRATALLINNCESNGAINIKCDVHAQALSKAVARHICEA